MKRLLFQTAALAVAGTLLLTAFRPEPRTTGLPAAPVADSARIQVAILLDVSGSMSGLIEQAKAQLWHMTDLLSRARCNGRAPVVEIALYEYGRPSNDAKTGYILRLSPFTTDLDELSKKLFSLNTDGGDEYCGQVIHASLNELPWDTAAGTYKVIFIAGNEDFLQGRLHYTQACAEANRKGVIVNTIYCGPREQGIREHWNLQGECGRGNFTHINHNASAEEPPTPYDSMLLVLNTQLNGTYIGYGATGVRAKAKQEEVDALNNAVRGMAVKRTVVKGKKGVYKNTAWDLVDAYEADSSFIARVELNTLPDSLKGRSRSALKSFVLQQQQERNRIQKEISGLAVQREAYIEAERRRNAASGGELTLETEMEKIIREQAGRFGVLIGKQ
ncbi:MAG TPA: vWA domain-containing protein [Chitinophagaceae bacterium]|jgi:hypothetical protein|nr:vWA domain-containing protein [Chitinophagaceae bacterium]